MNTEGRPITVAHGMGRPAAEPEAEGEATTRPGERQTPMIDIHETPDGLVLEADLPGAADSGLNVQLEDNVLTLHARVEPTVPENARPIHQEYRPGEYHRSFILSDEVDRERIAAELKNGVLRLSLPKAERSRPRRIEIKTS